MRHFLFGMIGSALIFGAMCHAQTATDLNEGCRLTQNPSTGAFTFGWWGKNARTYFIQQSDDLVTWSYMPVIESGADEVTEYGFMYTGQQRMFFRLRHTDAATGGDPDTADFDGDGLTNLEEVGEDGAHTDPLVADTDGDTFGDGFEVQVGTDPLSAADSPLTLVAQRLTTLQAMVAAYLDLVAAGTSTIDELAYAWVEVSSYAASLQALNDDAYYATGDTGVQASLDALLDQADDALEDAGEDPGTPPVIRLALQVKEVSNLWYPGGGSGGGGSLWVRFNGSTVSYEEGNFVAGWISALNNLDWPETMTESNSMMGSLNSNIGTTHTWYDSGFGGAGELVVVRDSRISLRSDKPVTATVTQTYIRVLETFDFGTPEFLPDVFLGVDTLTIPQGGTKSSGTSGGMITINHPGLVDEARQDIVLRPLEIVRDYDVPDDYWQSITGQMARALPGQRINLKLQAPELPEGVVISNFTWYISGALFENYEVSSTTGHLTSSTANGSAYTEVGFYWADTGQKSVSVTYQVNGELHESSVIFEVVKPVSRLSSEIGAPVKVGNSYVELQSALDDGIMFLKCGVEELPTEFGGQGHWNFVQIIKDGSHGTLADGRLAEGNHYQEWVCDTKYPYEPGNKFDSYSHPTGTDIRWDTGSLQGCGDSPRLYLDRVVDGQFFNKIGTVDLFKMYVMFLPPGEASRYVPLKMIYWYWTFEATKTSGVWSFVTDSDDADAYEAVETSEHPKWESNWMPFSWVPH